MAGRASATSGDTPSQPSRDLPPAGYTVCVGAILKDEDAFVEEWVAYHRILGVDHFYLYDNDPRQPLSEILARHGDYVTVRPWLIGHDDPSYRGRTKQIKAYTHCLENGAGRYDWVGFIDCDEFIALEEHRDLKAFLAEFEGHDSIALNWHVFGHNGYYDDPPGLVIECLTRRMKEPRAMTKSLSRPGAIVSFQNAHLCRLMAGCTCVDANKQPYRDALYPGKTRVARINHYQCRSFTNWMRKPERGEVGTFAEEPANAWRFSEEGCLRQFVSQIAVDKNEHVDMSMLRHVEPVRRYLSQLRSGNEVGQKSIVDLAATATLNKERQLRPPRNRQLDDSVLKKFTRSLRSTFLSFLLLPGDARHGRRFLWSLLSGKLTQAVAMISGRRRRNAIVLARAISKKQNWPEAVRRWQQVIDQFGEDAPPAAFAGLSRAHQGCGNLDAAEATAQQGRAKYPTDIGLAIRWAGVAASHKHWQEAERRSRTILDHANGDVPAQAYLQLSASLRRQDKIEEAEEFLRQGLSKHPADVRLAKSYVEVAKRLPDAATRWQAILDQLDGSCPTLFYLLASRAHREQGDLNEAARVVRQGLANEPRDIRLLTEHIEIAWACRDWGQVAETSDAAMRIIETSSSRTINDRVFATVCHGLMKGQNYDRVIAAVQHAKRRKGDSRLLLSIEGLAYLRSSRMEFARAHWDRVWQKAKKDERLARQPAPAAPRSHAPNLAFFKSLSRTDDLSPKSGDPRFCVYTALFGEYDDLRSPAYVPAGLNFICFSDRARDVAGWDVRVVDQGPACPATKSRLLKILPYDYLEDYDCSLYIDANVIFLADPLVVYRRWLKGKTFVAWSHPERAGVYEEIEAILVNFRHAPDGLIDQYLHFRQQRVPDQTGLIEALFLWRDHRDAAIRKLMQEWWQTLRRFKCHRDQPALGYLMWRDGIRPDVLPAYLGTSRDNDFFRKLPHRKTALDVERENVKPRRPVKTQAGVRASAKATNRSVNSAQATVPRLTWVCRHAFRSSASTVMRGQQLSEMARRLLADVEVSYVDETQLGAQSGSVLVLTKGFLKGATVDDLSELKERGNIICADPIDDPVRDELLDCVDVYIAASMTQFIHYSKQYADKLVHLITHHSDPRLNGIKGPDDRCRIGYFGEIANARYFNELRGTIDFCLVDTTTANATWIPKLRECNVHYALRKTRRIDGFKPFLKGFTAASCRSNIIVTRDESDARYYLGSDYPFILKDELVERRPGND